MKITLTERQGEAVIDVLNERMAGGIDDLKDALGLSQKQANATWAALGRALVKIQDAMPRRAVTHLEDILNNDLSSLRENRR